MNAGHRTESLVDVHAHFITERYVAEARAAGHTQPDGMPAWPEWSVESSLQTMDQAGIAKAYLSISSPGVHFGQDAAARELARHVNQAAAAMREAHPERFGLFASLPLPDVAGSLAEARYALDELEADGVALESNAHGTYLGHPDLAPLWEELDARKAVVFVHPTSPACGQELFLDRPRPMFEFLVDTARTVSDLMFTGTLGQYRHIQWIFTHGGGLLPLLADRFELFRTGFMGDDSVAPIHQQLSRLWFDMAGTPFPRQIPALAEVVGTGQILYGSDSCWTPAPVVLEQVHSIDAAVQPAPEQGGGTWRGLTTRNARRILS